MKASYPIIVKSMFKLCFRYNSTTNSKDRNPTSVRNYVKLGVSLRVLCSMVDTGYGLGRSLRGLQTCIAERSKVPNG